jgi:hypothetical protein
VEEAVTERWRSGGDDTRVVEQWFAGGGATGWKELSERTVGLKRREKSRVGVCGTGLKINKPMRS